MDPPEGDMGELPALEQHRVLNVRAACPLLPYPPARLFACFVRIYSKSSSQIINVLLASAGQTLAV